MQAAKEDSKLHLVKLDFVGRSQLLPELTTEVVTNTIWHFIDKYINFVCHVCRQEPEKVPHSGQVSEEPKHR